MRIALALAFLALASSPGFADTIWVPDNFATIQAAINAADNGDEVVVRPGTYVENIDFRGKAITLKSERGPSVTTIDGNQAGSVVTFVAREGLDSVLDGFTITNGDASVGGGIYCHDSSPTITNNTISGNRASVYGGGVCCWWYSKPIIANNTIAENTADRAGGICCHFSSSPTVTNNTIAENTADRGGGVYCHGYSNPAITNNTISGNEAAWGGGISCNFNSSPAITDNIIAGNTSDDGGGISCHFSSYPMITNNAITGNTSASDGGGIYCYDSFPTITNNTITGNTSLDHGGGIAFFEYSSATISNTILWDNNASSNPEIHGYPTVTYSCIKGGRPGIGNIDSDPLFLDPTHGDFRIQQDPCQTGVVNPCVDAGDPGSPMIEGTTRTDYVQDAGRVDMGFHYSLTSSWAFFRNDTGDKNAAGFVASAPVVGNDWIATVDNTGTGNFLAGVMGYKNPLDLYIPSIGSFLLIDPLSPGGELLHLSPAYGYGLVTFVRPVPNDPILAGATLSAQGAGFGGSGDTTLHNAYDLYIGQ